MFKLLPKSYIYLYEEPRLHGGPSTTRESGKCVWFLSMPASLVQERPAIVCSERCKTKVANSEVKKKVKLSETNTREELWNTKEFISLEAFTLTVFKTLCRSTAHLQVTFSPLTLYLQILILAMAS